MGEAMIRNRLKYTEPDYSQDWEYTTNATATLVTKYIGSNTEVIVPNKIGSKPVIMNISNYSNGVFVNNPNITSITFRDNINFINNDMSYTFYNCSNLKTVSNMPNSVTNMLQTFYECHNLTQVDVIPNNVTNMYRTFYNCYNLVQSPNIPINVTNMSYTFYFCQKITSTPVIPNSVTNLCGSFYYCTGLQNVVGNIPHSVTDMGSTFRYCSNLIGNIIIESENITTFLNCFHNTNSSKVKNVYIPCLYGNHEYTITYNSAYNASSGIKISGIKIFDLNPGGGSN